MIDDGLHYGILGPLEVRRGGDVIVLARPKLRALLALLLMNANRVVPRASVIDGIWGEDPPAAAVPGLHTLVSQLRAALGDVVVSQPPGYMLRVTPGSVDADRFAELCGEARAARTPDRAVRLLDDALALWRGRPLDDCPLPPARLQPFAAELVAARRVAAADRVDAALECGRHTEVLAELEGRVRGDALDERARGQLMLALYRSGRQSDALAAYRSGHREMATLGIEPSPRLRGLERAILAHDPSLAAPARPRPARHHRNVRVLAAAVAAVVVAAAALALMLSGGDGHAAPSVPPGVLRGGALLYDSASLDLVRAVPYPAAGTSAAPGFGDLWIGTGTGVLSVNLRTGRRAGGLTRISSGVRSVVTGDDFVWAANQDSSHPRVYKIEPSSGSIKGSTRYPHVPLPQLFEGEGFLWLTGGGHVTRIDPTGQGSPVPIPVDPTQNGANPQVMAFGDGRAWIIAETAREPDQHGQRGVLYEIDPQRARILHRIAIPNAVGSQDAFEVAYGEGAVWVADRNRGRLWRLDPGTPAPSVVAHLGFIDAVAVGAGAVWAITDHKTLSGAHPTLVKLAPDGRVLHRRALPGSPQDVNVQGGLVAVSYGG